MSELLKAGLVLEGGGMRGMYTAGVLDCFMDNDIYFEDNYGVSAGACQLANYISKQPGRAQRITMNYIDDERYFGMKSLLKTGDLFGVEMCYDTIPNELDLYDYDTADAFPGKAWAVATDMETGKAAYLPMKDMRKDIQAVRASASLPLVSRNVEIDGRLYLDGGMADSIPIRQSVKNGNKKNVIVLTRPGDYRKKPQTKANKSLMLAKYYKYPNLRKTMSRRSMVYNRTLELIEKAEAAGKVFVLRPERLISIDRIETDRRKLKILYLQGYHDAAMNLKVMLDYIKG